MYSIITAALPLLEYDTIPCLAVGLATQRTLYDLSTVVCTILPPAQELLYEC